MTIPTHEDVARLLYEGWTLDEIEGFIEGLPGAEDEKAALWLWAWAKRSLSHRG